MADESTIRAILTGCSGLTALVGTRIYDEIAPQNLPTPVQRPYLVMTVPSEVPYNFLKGAPSSAEFRVQFDVYADSKASARAVIAQLRAALHAAGHTGCEQLTQALPAEDVNLRRLSSDWLFVLSR